MPQQLLHDAHSGTALEQWVANVCPHGFVRGTADSMPAATAASWSTCQALCREIAAARIQEIAAWAGAERDRGA